MTLNDNPLTEMQKRFKILNYRKDRIAGYLSSRLSLVFENGVVARAYINPKLKRKKADRLMQVINKELTLIQKILRKYI